MKKWFWLTKFIIASKVVVAILLAQLFVGESKTNSISNSYAVGSLSSLEQAIEQADESWNTLVAILVYNSDSDNNDDLQEITKAFVRASRDKRYKNYIDFVRLDVGDFKSSDIGSLKKVGIKQSHLQEPTLVLYYNGEPMGDTLAGKRLDSTKQVSDFVDDHLGRDVERLKNIDKPKRREVVRYYDDSPRSSYSYHSDFGWPFHYNRYGAYPYRHPFYGYGGYYSGPGSGFYFGW